MEYLIFGTFKRINFHITFCDIHHNSFLINTQEVIVNRYFRLTAYSHPNFISIDKLSTNYIAAMIRASCISLCYLFSLPLLAQRNEQLWLDYQLDYPFATQYLFEVTSSYQTLLSEDNKWRSIGVTPTIEYLAFRRFDFLANLPMIYTLQVSGSSSAEIDPSVGVRFHITQGKRINTRLIYKLEERIFRTVETRDWQTSTRSRIKAEATISINKSNLFYDKLWYAIVDYEEFIVFDRQLDERYANRRRARMGLGYRLDYKNRFELLYAKQSSRNEIDGDYISNDNVIQLKYKMFLNPAKPVTPDQ